MVLVLAAGALVSVIAIFWASLRTLVGETPLSGADAYALGAPRAEEEQKRAVLRALKDLEFEHSVGKISEEDYEALVARYRADAKRLLRVIDEHADPARRKVEDLVAARLFREGLADPPAPPYRGGSEAKAVKRKKKGSPAKVPGHAGSPVGVPGHAGSPVGVPGHAGSPVGVPGHAGSPVGVPAALAADPSNVEPPAEKRECASCGTRNDPDAVFCKKCGARQNDEAVEKPEKEAT